VNANQRFDIILQQRLDERKANGLLRELVCPDGKIDFSSNDYLGFAQLPQLKNIADNNLASGSTGSRLISGNSQLAEETEKLIAQFHKAEAALIFNSGYMANCGLFSCIASKQDTFIADEYIHASIIDGMRLSHANRYKFKHNDLLDLEKKLQQSTGNRFIVIESIYSMDGDEAPLKKIIALSKKYDTLVIVDEAHANGVFGENGEGLVIKYNLQDEVYASVYTFGKALGLHGAVVTGSDALRNFLINYARAFIYTTALPPHTYLQIQQVYKLLPTANRTKLFELIEYFKSSIQQLKNISFIESYSPIQAITIADNFKAKALANHLNEKGFFIKAILSPTVAVGTERLRICLHSFNTKEQIDLLLNEIKTFTA
jgi:8-amino-7-oxononanoate synthase